MWRMRCTYPEDLAKAATLPGVAAAFFGAVLALAPAPAPADVSGAQILAAELLVAQGDIAFLESPDLPQPHRAGFTDRITGELGLLPWLLIQAGDREGAARIADWQARWTGADDQLGALNDALAALSERHPLDMSVLDAPLTHTSRAEARAIHEEYCAGCHDGLGMGDPESELAGRDLFLMARREDRRVFLARLVNGVKGDESIGFVNPLTEAQIGAMWKFYTHYQSE